MNGALDELLTETESLTRLLLGGATDRPPPTTRASMSWLPGADGRLVVTDRHVNASLEELMGETSTLTRLLLGGASDRPPPTTRASMGWLPGAQENHPSSSAPHATPVSRRPT